MTLKLHLISILLFLFSNGYSQIDEFEKQDTIKINNLNEIGRDLIINGNYQKADSIINIAVELSQKINFKSGLFNSLTNKGVIYWYKDNYPKALDYQLKASHVAEQINNKLFISRALANIGLIYSRKKNYEKALDYYGKALKIKEEIGDKKAVVIILSNIAKIHYDKHDNKNALEYYFSSLKVNETLTNSDGLTALNYAGIGSIYREQGDFLKAKYYFNNALHIADSLNDKILTSSTLINIGWLNSLQGNYKVAELSLNSALKLAIEIGSITNQRDAYFKLSEMYGNSNKWDLSLLNYKKYIKTQDNIFNSGNTKKMVQLEMNYEFDKKEEVTKLERQQKDEVAQAESKKQQIIIWSITGILGLVLIFAIYVYRSFKEKQRINIAITHQKHIIEEKQKEILDSIYYAKRIQTALITSETYINRTLNRLIN